MLTQFKQINNERECNEGGIHNAGFIVSSKNSAKPFEPSKQAFHFDARDYQVQTKPLSFGRLAGEWLELKASQIKRPSLWSIQSGITRARDVWGQVDIKNIQYPQIEDFIKSYPGTPKTRANILAVLKQLFAWAYDRCDIP